MNPKKLPVSVIILTFNEEANIGRCLGGVSSAFDQVFVVDSFSTDKTQEVALRYLPSDSFVQHPFEGYSEQRNWSQTHLPIRNEWVLHLDADEFVTKELLEEAAQLFDRGTDADGFMLPVRAVFLGRLLRYGFVNPVYHTRLFKVKAGRCDSRKWDNHFVVEGRMEKLRNGLHNHVCPDLTTWVRRHTRMAGLEVEEVFNKDGRPAAKGSHEVRPDFFGTPIERRKWLWSKIYYRFPKFVRPISFFFFRYVICLGFLDGREGLIYHFFHLWYRFFVDALILEAGRKERSAGKE